MAFFHFECIYLHNVIYFISQRRGVYGFARVQVFGTARMIPSIALGFGVRLGEYYRFIETLWLDSCI